MKSSTSYHALDFFLMADCHVTVATPDPTSVLDLYRFIKLAAIRRVLSSFLARDAMSDALSDRDFCSVEEVLEVAGHTDEAGRAIAETTLRTFHPALILNRLSGRSHVKMCPHSKSFSLSISAASSRCWEKFQTIRRWNVPSEAFSRWPNTSRPLRRPRRFAPLPTDWPTMLERWRKLEDVLHSAAFGSSLFPLADIAAAA